MQEHHAKRAHFALQMPHTFVRFPLIEGRMEHTRVLRSDQHAHHSLETQ